MNLTWCAGGLLFLPISEDCTAHPERVSTYYNMYILAQSRDVQGHDVPFIHVLPIHVLFIRVSPTHVSPTHVLNTGGAEGKM